MILGNPSFSEIRDHSLSYDHPFNEACFSILYRARDLNELRIAESILIHKQKPKLNNYSISVKLNTLGSVQ